MFLFFKLLETSTILPLGHWTLFCLLLFTLSYGFYFSNNHLFSHIQMHRLFLPLSSFQHLTD